MPLLMLAASSCRGEESMVPFAQGTSISRWIEPVVSRLLPWRSNAFAELVELEPADFGGALILPRKIGLFL
jgi:hypothetical protein